MTTNTLFITLKTFVPLKKKGKRALKTKMICILKIICKGKNKA